MPESTKRGLDYAFGLFVFAAVLIARISIEEGREYAAMFALPLAGRDVLGSAEVCGASESVHLI